MPSVLRPGRTTLLVLTGRPTKGMRGRSSHDGLPDAWERAHGLDPDNPQDDISDLDGGGYTSVEEYVNELFEKSKSARGDLDESEVRWNQSAFDVNSFGLLSGAARAMVLECRNPGRGQKRVDGVLALGSNERGGI